MTPVLDEGQIRAWLTNLYSECSGYINIVSTDNWAGQSFRDVDQAIQYIKLVDRRRPKGIYARVTTLAAPSRDKKRGTLEDTGEFIGFWADLDIAGPGHKTDQPLPASVDDCLAILAETGLPEPTEIIHSGGGIYPWWLLRSPITIYPDNFGFIRLSAQWQRVIELASAKLGFHYGAGVGDLTRVLRIPGTINRKVEDAPTPCEWRMDLTKSHAYDEMELLAALCASIDRLEPPKPATALPIPFITPATGFTDGVRPGDAFNQATSWPQLLEADGGVIFKGTGYGYTEWTRPGKDRREGPSATTGHKGSDVLKVFTDSWPGLRQDSTYDRFGYYAATHHNGNIPAAASALAALGYGNPGTRTASAGVITHTPADRELPPGEQGQVERTYSFTDSGYANKFQDRHGHDWRYVASRKQWLHWDGTLWTPDDKGAVTNLIDRMAQADYARADDKEDEAAAEKHRKAVKPMLSSRNQLGATAVLSRRPEIAIDADDLDALRQYVTCTNGVINLNDGSFSDHHREYLATKKLGVAYDPAASAPRWQKFLEDILPDPAIRDYVQRAAGYTLTGDANRKAIFMLHGPSHTGKSQLINALTMIFGGFAQTAKEQTLQVNTSPTAATPGLAKLRGARFVAASETTEGVRLDEALIKRLTGDEEIQSRGLYQDEESWLPQFAMWLATNHLPKFNSDDAAIWRRVKPIHFNVVFGTSDHPEEFSIGRRLVEEEGPGILNWMLAGVAAYRERGLDDPEELRQAVVEYRNDSDPVATFIKEAIEEGRLVADEDGVIGSRVLYGHFAAWCEQEGIRYPLSANRFGRRMTTLGYRQQRAADYRMWAGLKLTTAAATGTWVASALPIRQ